MWSFGKTWSLWRGQKSTEHVQTVMYQMRATSVRQRYVAWLFTSSGHKAMYSTAQVCQSFCQLVGNTREWSINSHEFRKNLISRYFGWSEWVLSKQKKCSRLCGTDCVNVDSDEDCERKANESQCVINPRYMLTYCRLTCTRCAQQPGIYATHRSSSSSSSSSSLLSFIPVLPDLFNLRSPLKIHPTDGMFTDACRLPIIRGRQRFNLHRPLAYMRPDTVKGKNR